MLVLASGGLTGLRGQEALPQAMLPAEERRPLESASASGSPALACQGSFAPAAQGRPERFLTGWHASAAKNTAHVFGAREARDEAEQDVLLLNLDCDNFLTHDFLQAVLSAQEVLPQSHWLYGSVNTSDPGTTGRIWMNLSLFFHVGGYDEDTQPSGYQDVDLRRRLEAASKKKEALPRIQKIDRQVISGGIGAVGGTMANSTVSRSVDRWEAKIRNCAPEVRASFASWHQMNTVNAVACQERLKKGHIMRN